MPNNKTITINGRVYDAVTGLPINKAAYDVSRPSTPKKVEKKTEVKEKPAPKPVVERAPATVANEVHGQTQRSHTLARRSVKKPTKAVKRPTTGRHMDMARSSKITKFAPHPVVKPAEVKAIVKAQAAAAKPDKAPQVHPIAAKAVTRAAVAKPVAQKPATTKEVKDAAIAKALATPKAKPVKKSKKQNKWVRRISIVGIIALALGLILYGVYHFVPSVSVGIASAQAGVKATYPEYVPDGYALSHPVTYEEGEVTLIFKSNSNDNSYSITQESSTWDSSAVLDRVVRPVSGEDYSTTKERGLTVYAYNNGKSAAWVNGGVLYVISSNDAPLSGEQIRHIATSL
ncbi:MAG: DUF4367 domain-containing protein [Patescibacteria group bacterium]